eukprot:3425913-Rhodomonas_salina.1
MCIRDSATSVQSPRVRTHCHFSTSVLTIIPLHQCSGTCPTLDNNQPWGRAWDVLCRGTTDGRGTRERFRMILA